MNGPTDALRVTDYTVPVAAFTQEQIQVAFAEDHGFSSATAGIPPFPLILGGLFDPTIWATPVTNEVTLTVARGCGARHVGRRDQGPARLRG